MAVATQHMSAIPMDGKPAHATAPGKMASVDSEIITVTDLILSKVRETPDAIFAQYPATPKGRSDYVGYTVADIDRLADQAAQRYMDRGLKPEVNFCCRL